MNEEDSVEEVQQSALAQVLAGTGPAGEEVVEAAAPTKRKRRTKAEMAAANGEAAAPALAPPAALETELEQWAQAARDRLEVIALVDIETQEEMNELGAWQREAFEQTKALTAKRLEITRPMDAAKTQVMNLFKPALGYYGAIEEACKQKIKVFQLAAQAAQDAALKAVAESGGQANPETLVVAHGEGVLALPETVRQKVTYKWTVTDKDKIPEIYWQRVLNTALIDGVVSEQGFDADIPGLRIEREVDIVNKAVRK